MPNWERSAGGCGCKAGNKGAVKDNNVFKFDRTTGAGANGATNANKYSSAGSRSPSPSFNPLCFSFCTVPSSVVSSAA